MADGTVVKDGNVGWVRTQKGFDGFAGSESERAQRGPKGEGGDSPSHPTPSAISGALEMVDGTTVKYSHVGVGEKPESSRFVPRLWVYRCRISVQ